MYQYNRFSIKIMIYNNKITSLTKALVCAHCAMMPLTSAAESLRTIAFNIYVIVLSRKKISIKVANTKNFFIFLDVLTKNK